VALGVTRGGADRLRADLTPQATAALQAILDALGKSAEPGGSVQQWPFRVSTTPWRRRAGG
jgi:hypothetical protein